MIKPNPWPKTRESSALRSSMSDNNNNTIFCQQGAITAAMANPSLGTSGSASSVAIGSAGRPAMLALPAPQTTTQQVTSTMNVDPFAASLVVAPLAYVQMSEFEKKQKLVVEEQMMWQQYAGDGDEILGAKLDAVKSKGARQRQWQIACSFPTFRWTIVLVPLWVRDVLRRDFSVGVYHSRKPNRGLCSMVV